MPPVCSWMTFAPVVEMVAGVNVGVDIGLHDADAQTRPSGR